MPGAASRSGSFSEVRAVFAARDSRGLADGTPDLRVCGCRLARVGEWHPKTARTGDFLPPLAPQDGTLRRETVKEQGVFVPRGRLRGWVCQEAACRGCACWESASRGCPCWLSACRGGHQTKSRLAKANLLDSRLQRANLPRTGLQRAFPPSASPIPAGPPSASAITADGPTAFGNESFFFGGLGLVRRLEE